VFLKLLTAPIGVKVVAVPPVVPPMETTAPIPATCAADCPAIRVGVLISMFTYFTD
jgi:hypothetical protein